MEEFVYGTGKRIFINTALGCNANCKYCYLPHLGYERKKKVISGETAVQMLRNMSCFEEGKNGTIISIGCYSECLDKQNMKETKKIIQNVLPLGNKVQLATKQSVTEEVCKLIERNRIFTEQMKVYISMPTFSLISQMEPGTVPVELRIRNIEKCMKYNIPVVLYIKPFMDKITDLDLEQYINILKTYKIPVVVGGYLYTEKADMVADVGNGRLYETDHIEERKKFVHELKKYSKVYEHSTELL